MRFVEINGIDDLVGKGHLALLQINTAVPFRDYDADPVMFIGIHELVGKSDDAVSYLLPPA